MCGASARVSLTPSLISRRSPLRLYRNGVAIFCSSCHSFVTHSTLSWSHDTQIEDSACLSEEYSVSSKLRRRNRLWLQESPCGIS
jgi:hypothetical protein